MNSQCGLEPKSCAELAAFVADMSPVSIFFLLAFFFWFESLQFCVRARVALDLDSIRAF